MLGMVIQCELCIRIPCNIPQVGQLVFDMLYHVHYRTINNMTNTTYVAFIVETQLEFSITVSLSRFIAGSISDALSLVTALTRGAMLYSVRTLHGISDVVHWL